MKKLNPREASRLIGMTPTSLRSYANRELLPVERKGVGGYYFFDVADLRKFAEKYNIDFNEEELKKILSEDD